jgi:anti-sigma regulatory factor (Ser/Thr protein kinase)
MSACGCSMRAEIPATVEAVESLAMVFRGRCPAMCKIETFSAELLLREALVNALDYGSGRDPAKRIFCAIRVKRGRLVIVVRDEGMGFDWHAAMRRQSSLADDRGRGLEIFRQYASRVRFNAKGNAVALLRRIKTSSRQKTGDERDVYRDE